MMEDAINPVGHPTPYPTASFARDVMFNAKPVRTPLLNAYHVILLQVPTSNISIKILVLERVPTDTMMIIHYLFAQFAQNLVNTVKIRQLTLARAALVILVFWDSNVFQNVRMASIRLLTIHVRPVSGSVLPALRLHCA